MLFSIISRQAMHLSIWTSSFSWWPARWVLARHGGYYSKTCWRLRRRWAANEENEPVSHHLPPSTRMSEHGCSGMEVMVCICFFPTYTAGSGWYKCNHSPVLMSWKSSEFLLITHLHLIVCIPFLRWCSVQTSVSLQSLIIDTHFCLIVIIVHWLRNNYIGSNIFYIVGGGPDQMFSSHVWENESYIIGLFRYCNLLCQNKYPLAKKWIRIQWLYMFLFFQYWM